MVNVGSKIRPVSDSIGAIEDGQTVIILGAGGGVLEPDLLIQALGERFDRTRSPRDLVIYHTLGLGDRDTRGLSPIAREGLVSKAIGSHWGQTPAMSRLAEAELIEAYNLPAGVMSLLLREAAGGRPGLVSKIGLGTFVDPRLEGGRLNERSKDQLVEVVELRGEEWLFYPSPRFDVALVRGWLADESGNISFRDEPSYLDAYATAAAARATGGRIIVQVKEVVPRGDLHPKDVHIPAALVDEVVVHPEQWQTYNDETNSGYAGHVRTARAKADSFAFGARKLIARRAALELFPGAVVNLGVGVPDGVASVLEEEGVHDQVTFTVEHGIFGGITAQGIVFGASRNHDAVVPMPEMFDFYHSGGLDIAFLGFAQADQHGNVNVSKFQGTIMGTGGFVDISQRAKAVVFCGTFTAQGLEVEYGDGRAKIVREGRVTKLVDHADQITFSGEEARRIGQRVVVVTERAVFALGGKGLELTEVVDGIDVERDVIAHMGFVPKVREPLTTLSHGLVSDAALGLAGRWGVCG